MKKLSEKILSLNITLIAAKFFLSVFLDNAEKRGMNDVVIQWLQSVAIPFLDNLFPILLICLPFSFIYWLFLKLISKNNDTQKPSVILNGSSQIRNLTDEERETLQNAIEWCQKNNHLFFFFFLVFLTLGIYFVLQESTTFPQVLNTLYEPHPRMFLLILATCFLFGYLRNHNLTHLYKLDLEAPVEQKMQTVQVENISKYFIREGNYLMEFLEILSKGRGIIQDYIPGLRREWGIVIGKIVIREPDFKKTFSQPLVDGEKIEVEYSPNSLYLWKAGKVV